MIYYHDEKIFAARKGDFKLYFYKNNLAGYPQQLEKLESLKLFNLQQDPSERFDIADKHANIVAEIEKMVQVHQATIVPVASELDR